MLVTLGTNQAIGAGSSATFTYSPQSLQQVMLRIEDATGSHSLDATVTVQIGSRVICNGINTFGLMGLTTLSSGVDQSTSDCTLKLNFGSHECTNNDNVYVTVASAQALDAVDVSAIVDEPGLGTPVRLTSYSDNTFTANNALQGIAFKSTRGAVDEDASNCEIRTSIYSSAPTVISGASWFKANSFSANAYPDDFAIVFNNGVPLHTTVNYPSTATIDTVITVEQDPVSRAQISAGRQSARIARSLAGK